MDRILGCGGVKIELDPSEEEEEDEKKRREAEQGAQFMVVLHMISCRTLQFLTSSSNQATSLLRLAESEPSYHLGYTTSIDSDVEIYDLATNRKWRCEPRKGAPPPMHQNRQSRTLDPEAAIDKTGLIGWDYIPPSGPESREQIFSVHSDVLRRWELDL